MTPLRVTPWPKASRGPGRGPTVTAFPLWALRRQDGSHCAQGAAGSSPGPPGWERPQPVPGIPAGPWGCWSRWPGWSTLPAAGRQTVGLLGSHTPSFQTRFTHQKTILRTTLPHPQTGGNWQSMELVQNAGQLCLLNGPLTDCTYGTITSPLHLQWMLTASCCF